MRILLVDDDYHSLESTRRILEHAEFQVVTAKDGREALEQARQSSFSLIISDVRMPQMDGLEFLRALTQSNSNTPVILMTAYGRVEDAVLAMKTGAADFLTKPFKRQQLLDSISRTLSFSKKPSKIREEEKLSELIGQSPVIQSLRDLVDRVAPTTATVLITGESGTGKEVLARLIQQKSARSGKPFIALNCAAIPSDLIESELFGHEKGAFTGAESAKVGIFEAASGGTLFLDEIGDMPLPAQSKLLRVLQEGEVRRIGSVHSRKVDVRLIAATHQDLQKKVISGEFRQDLLYRLEVVRIEVPALRHRMQDLDLLIDYFIQQGVLRNQLSEPKITTEWRERLHQHSWPGNIRELSNVVERSLILAVSGVLDCQVLPTHLQKTVATSFSESDQVLQIPIGSSLKDVESILIRKTLEATDGDKAETARLLGVHSRTIYRWLKEEEERK